MDLCGAFFVAVFKGCLGGVFGGFDGVFDGARNEGVGIEGSGSAFDLPFGGKGGPTKS